jgi:septal ring-binding cell division protein DamX
MPHRKSLALVAATMLAAGSALAQAPAKPASQPAAPASAPLATPSTAASPAQAPDPLAALAWLAGCWAGDVNQRAYTEQWTKPAAGMMLGLGHTVMAGRTLSFEFMRIEARSDGSIAYVAKPTDKPEEAFVYQGTKDDHGATRYTFANPSRDFPTEIAYAHTPADEVFAYVIGKVNGQDRQVIYPFRRVDCPAPSAAPATTATAAPATTATATPAATEPPAPPK